MWYEYTTLNCSVEKSLLDMYIPTRKISIILSDYRIDNWRNEETEFCKMAYKIQRYLGSELNRISAGNSIYGLCHSD